MISGAGAVPTARLVSFVSSLIGALIGGGILWGVGEAYFRVRGVEGMGFGDVKMMAMVGAFLGTPLAVMTIMLGSLVGSVVGLSLMRFGGTDRNYELPFGTFLSFGAIASLLVGNELLRWYLNFMAPGTLG
jgi:leader peptidase (prepilin peptidase)/N-methyltransferase